jgi:RNA polymerase sigma factor (sigma-70 family)
MKMSDQEIIEHLLNDRYNKAVKGLYGSYPSARKWIVANSGNKEDAEDIFQEALLVLYKKVKAGGFVLSSSLKTYLTGISRNLWLKELKRKGIEVPMEKFHGIAEESLADGEQQFKVAEMAFNLLGEKCKQLLLLFYFKKKSMGEISRILEFSNEGVTKNQKYRCLEKAKNNYTNLLNEAVL